MISMKSSVCMAVYNGEEYLKKQLVSTLEQLDIGDKIIVVNDTSTDN
jgi:glycosyltransferase involved in cell wall biosynthesis